MVVAKSIWYLVSSATRAGSRTLLGSHRATRRIPSGGVYVMHYGRHYGMHYVAPCRTRGGGACVMQHVMHYVLHYVPHYVQHYVLHLVEHEAVVPM